MKLIITEEEKKRILEMHESATKRNYLMEADPVTPPTTNTTTSQVGYQNEVLPELKNNIFKFNKGASSIDSNSITNWDEYTKFRDAIVNYINKGKQIFELSVNGSESLTPGKMDNYKLAELRAKNMLQDFKNYITQKNKNIKIQSSASHPKMGKIEYKQGVDNANDPKYLNDQWAQIWVKLQK
jgi:hypothetical protein